MIGVVRYERIDTEQRRGRLQHRGRAPGPRHRLGLPRAHRGRRPRARHLDASSPTCCRRTARCCTSSRRPATSSTTSSRTASCGCPSTSSRPRPRAPSPTRASTAPRPPRSSGSCEPRSVAVIGASRSSHPSGSAVLRHLVDGGFTGTVHAVNPHADVVEGVPARPRVPDIPGDVDLAVVAVPADQVEQVVADCAAKGVHGLVVMSSGFAETGDEGARAAAPARRAGPWHRDAGPRPQLLRRAQHRPGVRAERLAVAAHAATAAGSASSPSPARSASRCSTTPYAAASVCPRSSQRGQPGRRQRQRPHAVLGGGRRAPRP